MLDTFPTPLLFEGVRATSRRTYNLATIANRVSNGHIPQEETANWWEVAMDKFIQAALSAVGALASFAPSPQITGYPHLSEMDALKSDWSRIGLDMRTVIERENGKIAKSEKPGRRIPA